jgi:hypothetical protein
VACTLYHPRGVVALLGEDADEKQIYFSSCSEDPITTAEILWLAADAGRDLAASMVRDDDVARPAVAAWRAEQREASGL